MAAAAIFKDRKIVISRPRFDPFRLARGRIFAIFSVPTPLVLPNKTAYIIKQNWNQFLLVVKATGLKQQISNFYPQILSTEASFYIYDRPLTDINVIATVCA